MKDHIGAGEQTVYLSWR